MKKSILIGMLAVLMLVAFTACNNQVAYKVPVGMTATTSKVDYLEGETVDPATISATVEYSDGSSQTISGTQLGIAAEKLTLTDAATVATKDITVTFGAGEKNSVASSVTVTVYAVSDVTLGNLPTEAASGGKIDTSDVTATVSYGVGKTRALQAGEFKVTASVTGSAGDKNVAVTGATVTVFDEHVASVLGAENWKVDIAEATKPAGTYDPEKFAEYKVVLTGPDGKEIVSADNAVAIPSTAYVGDEYTWAVYAYDTEGARAAAVENTDYFFVDNKKPSSKITLALDSSTTYSVKFKNDLSTVGVTITVPNGVDYIVGFASIVADEENAPTYGTAATDANYVFTANYKGAGAKVAEEGDFEATILDPTVPAAGESYRPRFYIEYGKKDAAGDFISVLPEQRATAAYVVE